MPNVLSRSQTIVSIIIQPPVLVMSARPACHHSDVNVQLHVDSHGENLETWACNRKASKINIKLREALAMM